MNPAMTTEVGVPQDLSGGALAEFEEVYRSNVGLVAAYFARRCWEPQEVADLTSETIVRAAGSFGAFDPRRGSARAWLFGIAAHVWAGYCASVAESRDAMGRLAGYRALETAEIDELAAKIDAQRAGRELLERCSRLSANERAAIELVDLAELTPKEAAAALGVPRGVLRMRLSRARARLRKEHCVDE
jgi:RNA polymerase sigma-70 factor (ECF subfamily)